MTAEAIEQMRLIRSGPSLGGSGVVVDTYVDSTGNEWMSIGGGRPEMSRTTADIERSAEMWALGQQLRREADAESAQDEAQQYAEQAEEKELHP